MATPAVFNKLLWTKRRFKAYTVSSLFLLFYSYLMMIYPLEKLLFVMDGSTSQHLLKIGISGILSSILSYLISSSDPLATGKGKASQYFRGLYASKAVASHYSVHMKRATDLWFRFFNKWPDSSHHSDWYHTLQRTYACRLIFILRGALFIMILFSMLSIAAVLLDSEGKVLSHSNPFSFLQVLYISILILLLAFLALTNRLPSKKRPEPMGCWFKYDETAGVQQSILENEIFKNAATYADAINLIDSL